MKTHLVFENKHGFWKFVAASNTPTTEAEVALTLGRKAHHYQVIP